MFFFPQEKALRHSDSLYNKYVLIDNIFCNIREKGKDLQTVVVKSPERTGYRNQKLLTNLDTKIKKKHDSKYQ